MEILLIIFLMLLNGVFAMSEIAIVSSRRTRLERMARHGDRRARAALGLRNNPNVFLSTVQIGITLIGILAGAVGQAAIAGDVQEDLRRLGMPAPYAGPLALAVVVVLITYLSLVIGELVPKRLALLRPERIARAAAVPMAVMARMTHPVVRLLSISVDAVLRLLRVRFVSEPSVTEEEIQAMIEEGTRSGVFLTAERELLQNVIRLADRPLGSLMTPRDEIVWLDVIDDFVINKEKIVKNRFSRFVLVRGGIDHPVGVVHTKDLLARVLSGEPVDFAAVAKPIPKVRTNASPLRVLELFRNSPLHIALVVNAIGEVRGLVTPHDLLDSIVGGLPTEEEAAEPMVVRREDGSLLLDGGLSVGELKEVLGVPALPDEESGAYQTLAGFVLAQAGRIPAVGERFGWRNFEFEVVDMDGRRVDRVLVKVRDWGAEET